MIVPVPFIYYIGPPKTAQFAGTGRPIVPPTLLRSDFTSARLYTFWVGIREEAGLGGLRIHDARHTYASQGLMNGVGLATVGKLLGHRNARPPRSTPISTTPRCATPPSRPRRFDRFIRI